MFKERLDRPRPHLDDKILTAWNGLMIAAFARMARVFRGLGGDGRAAGEPYLEAARRAAAFIRERMWNARSGTLLRRYRDGHAEIDGYAEDYAYLISGLLELFQADPTPMWLEWAIALQHRQDELFWDEAAGGWFSTTGSDPSVLLRMKEDYDGAEPTASSVSVLNLLVLSHLVHDPQWTDRIERTLRLFGTRLEQMGRGVPMMAAALSAYTAGLQQIVIVGRRRATIRWIAPLGADATCRSRFSCASRARGSARSPAACRSWRDAAGRRRDRRLRLPRFHLPSAGDHGRRARTGIGDDRMNVSVDVWLRGSDVATTATVEGIPRAPKRVDRRRRAAGARRDAAGDAPPEASGRGGPGRSRCAA